MTPDQFVDMQKILAQAFMPMIGLWSIAFMTIGVGLSITLIWLIVMRDRLI